MQRGAILIARGSSTGNPAHGPFSSFYSFYIKDTKRLLFLSKYSMAPFLADFATKISSCLPPIYFPFLPNSTLIWFGIAKCLTEIQDFLVLLGDDTLQVTEVWTEVTGWDFQECSRGTQHWAPLSLPWFWPWTWRWEVLSVSFNQKNWPQACQCWHILTNTWSALSTGQFNWSGHSNWWSHVACM